MRYSLEPNYRKYIQGYGFLLLARKFGDKCSKKLINTVIKTGTDATKTASKRTVQKTAEAARYLIGNKITSVGQSKNKEKEEKDETNETEKIYIPPDKRQKFIDDLRLF